MTTVHCSILVDSDGLTGGQGSTVAPRPGVLEDIEAGAPAVDGGADAPTSRYVTEVLTDQPLSYWRLEEADGPRIRDEMERHDGRYAGNVVHRAGGALSDGSFGVELDGTTSRLEMDDVFRFPGNAPYSVEGWVRSMVPPESDAAFSIFERSVPADVDYGFGMYFGKTYTLFMREVDTQGGFVQRAGALPRGEFVHFVATYDGRTNRLFLNGELAGASDDVRPLPDVAGAFVWGDFATPQDAKLTGTLDELAVYDHPLDELRARAHYEARR